MKKSSTIKVIALIFIFQLLLTGIFFFTQSIDEVEDEHLYVFNETKRVLLISSYSPSFETFYHQIEGVKDEFSSYDIILDVEFMDSKRFFTSENEYNFYQNIKYKIDYLPPYDLVISADDNALDFITKYQNELFNEIPIVFFGVNDIEKAESLMDNPFINGVVESASIFETIKIALELNSQAERVVAIVDNTISGQADLVSYYKLSGKLPNVRLEDLDSSHYSFEEYAKELGKLKETDIVILLSMYGDKYGDRIRFDEGLKYLLGNCNQPIYHPYMHGIGDGVLGGKVISHYDQANKAAEIALEKLCDKNESTIIFDGYKINKYIFDYDALNRYKLNENQLPSDTIFINKKESIFSEYKDFVLFSASFVLSLLLIIITLLYSNIQNKKSARELKLLSISDSLTGLYNRRYFEMEIKKYEEEKFLPLSIMVIDLNGLKLANDAFGHQIGDKLLIECAGTLKKTIGDSGTVFRIGGDEFAILLPITSLKQASEMWRSIDNAFINKKVDNMILSISIGYSTKVNFNQNIYDVFKVAEDYMYRDKLYDGRNQKNNMINIVMNTLHEKSSREKEHSERVAVLCRNFGIALGYSKFEINELYLIGLLHDVGKVIIDKSILNKEDKLDDEEWEIMKTHSEAGYRIMSSVSNLAALAEYVLCHHERWDGKGYPKGLVKEEIPFQSRILSLVDSYDAMVSGRPYKAAMTIQQASEEILRNKNKQFDPELAEFFVRKVIANKE